MKFFLFLFLSFFLFINSSLVNAQDALTVKQQLDRIMEEVRDLNKAVFNKSFDKNNLYSKKNNNENDVERFTSIDIRIYDLEKDIKSLTLQFEEILFKLDDISINMSSFEDKLTSKFENDLINSENDTYKKNENKNLIRSEVKEKNTLGKLVISDKNENLTITDSDNLLPKNKEQDQELNNLSPEEQLQFALDQMMKKNYDYSKKILKDFVINFPDNQLSGSAHFWLGKIYLFESDYRKAAIVFGEGVQKYPESIKASEMYYELAKSLKEMKKINESCKALSLLEKKYKGNKFAKDPEKIKIEMSCETQN